MHLHPSPYRRPHLAVLSVVLVSAAIVLASPQISASVTEDLPAIGSAVSPTWAGFVVENGHQPNITRISGSWAVPTVTCKPGENSNESTWVGLGGEYISPFQKWEGATVGEKLYQVGTNSNCVYGKPTYGTWKELFPPQNGHHQQPLDPSTSSFPVTHDDQITASVAISGSVTGYSIEATREGRTLWSTSGHWSTSMSGDHTAECIVEDTLGKRAPNPFARFGGVRFSTCAAAEGSQSYSLVVGRRSEPAHWTTTALTMKRGGVVLAVPDTSNASVSWGTGRAPGQLIWSAPVHIGSNGATLGGVSCASATLCQAVDSDGNVFSYNGTTWSQPQRVDPDGGGLFRVVCPSTRLCIAIDHSGNVVTFDGASWSAPQAVDTEGALNRISCPTTTFCMVVDDAGYALDWNGTSWSQPLPIDQNGVNDSALNVDNLAVSCGSPTSCVAVDGSGGALTFDGSTWSAPTSVDTEAGLLDVDCPTASFCVATDFGGAELTYANGTWSPPTTITSHGSGISSGYGGTGYDLGSLFPSCPVAGRCTAVDADGDAIALVGGRWGLPVNVDAANASLSGISCPTVAMCMAVDERGDAIVARAG